MLVVLSSQCVTHCSHSAGSTEPLTSSLKLAPACPVVLARPIWAVTITAIEIEVVSYLVRRDAHLQRRRLDYLQHR